VLGEAPNLEAHVVDDAINTGTPILQGCDNGLNGGHPIASLVVDFSEADELEVVHAGLEVVDALLEVISPIVGDD
jgi:hypothetical protein